MQIRKTTSHFWKIASGSSCLQRVLGKEKARKLSRAWAREVLFKHSESTRHPEGDTRCYERIPMWEKNTMPFALQNGIGDGKTLARAGKLEAH